MRLPRWTTVVMAVAMASAAGVAEAQDNVCVDLEARLVQLDRGGTGGDARQYDAPIAQQRDEIDRATAEARRSGCMGGFLIFRPTPQAKCGQLMATIDKMQSNLQRLSEARGQYDNDPYTIARQRSDVLNQLAANRCGGQYAASDAPQPGFGGFLDSLFGNARMQSLDDETPYSPGGGSGGGTYQTLCVRTCDGFYFPISFSTVPSQFSADEATCQSMCPGAEAELYTHLNPGEDASQMVSLSGQPYTALPNAFRFQREYDKTCTCRSASTAATGQGAIENFSDFGTGGLQPYVDPSATAAAAVPLPHVRPAGGEDPETIADRAGGFVPQPISPPGAAPSETADSDKGVRVVGPAFYYGQ